MQVLNEVHTYTYMYMYMYMHVVFTPFIAGWQHWSVIALPTQRYLFAAIGNGIKVYDVNGHESMYGYMYMCIQIQWPTKLVHFLHATLKLGE